MSSLEGSFSFHSISSAHPAAGCELAMNFDQLSQLISRNVQTITHNVAEMQTMLSHYGTRSDTLQLRDRLHEMQRATNQIAKETGTYVKDLNRLSASRHSLEPRHEKIQRERLVAEFMKVLNSFQTVQRMEKQMENSKSFPSSQPQSTASPFADDVPESSWPQTLRSEDIAGGRQQMSLQIDTSDVDSAVLREREDALVQLETDIMDVNQIFRDIGMLIHEQGDMIDSIEANVETAAVSVDEGVDQLRQARRSQAKARKKKCILVIVLLVILAVIIAVIVIAVKYS